MTSSPDPTVQAVWTDFGGVLTPPIAHTFTRFCTAMELDPEPLMKAIMKVTATYQTDDIMLPLDTPLVTEQEWLRQVGEVLRADTGIEVRLSTLADAWFDGRETNTAWVQRLRELRSRGLFVGLLSNMVPAWDAHWRRMVPASEFDDVLLSFEIGHRKPAREAFDLAVRRSGIAAEHSVFVDDLDSNCAGAEAAGWRAIHFTDTATAITLLDTLLGERAGALR
ncbi:HAD family hydrolase [Goodfellowiella coeruleoviolacea]|uniref:Hydrolase of the HAD superfamily n=1 Tax=Goodfellowiella coeruleoviolacea TaxID=334858 RepID=A0AAE3KF55_9PSEU|nr:HAD family phosphatase [Goodfellowiella coeruleoviolacea]MCP2164089.1 putative hydrolase of the HAD superfamily [Goodfellowiella coeruleoviolacea]